MPKTPEEIAAEEAEKVDKQPTVEEQLAAAKAEAEKWQALSKKNEARAKENADKAKSFDDLEEANRTELEKANARAEAAEKLIAERDAAEASKTLRAEVAKEKFAGREIPETALRGATREELEAHADEILALLPPLPEIPSADGQGGAGSVIGDGEMSADDIVAAATSR